MTQQPGKETQISFNSALFSFYEHQQDHELAQLAVTPTHPIPSVTVGELRQTMTQRQQEAKLLENKRFM